MAKGRAVEPFAFQPRDGTGGFKELDPSPFLAPTGPGTLPGPVSQRLCVGHASNPEGRS